jgi:hypothetical protein
MWKLLFPMLLLAAVVLYASQPTIEQVIKPFTSSGTTTDTVVSSQSLKIVNKDSVYRWIWYVDGAATVAFKLVSYYNGVPGDSITLDSATTLTGTEKLVATVSGDSLMDAAWKQWTSYSAIAREYRKERLESFSYKLFLVFYTAGTTVGYTAGVDRRYYVN